jgi:hypothetical protein
MLIAVGLAASSFAQAAKKEGAQAPQEDRFHGAITRFNTDKKTMELRSSRQNLSRTVVYDASTKWQDRAGKALTAMPTLKEGMDFICLGKFDKDGRLLATTCQLQTP